MTFMMSKEIQVNGNWIEVEAEVDVFEDEIDWQSNLVPVHPKEVSATDLEAIFKLDPNKVFTAGEVYAEEDRLKAAGWISTTYKIPGKFL